MKTSAPLLIASSLFLGLIMSPTWAGAEEFPLSSKGYQATVIKKEGLNSAKAMALGEVSPENAREYCDRDPGGETKEHGGKLTKEQCVEKVLEKEKGKQYAASANCLTRTIRTSWGETFTAVGKDARGRYLWRHNRTGKVLDGSNASGAPVVEGQFRLLCPGSH